MLKYSQVTKSAHLCEPVESIKILLFLLSRKIVSVQYKGRKRWIKGSMKDEGRKEGKSVCVGFWLWVGWEVLMGGSLVATPTFVPIGLAGCEYSGLLTPQTSALPTSTNHHNPKITYYTNISARTHLSLSHLLPCYLLQYFSSYTRRDLQHLIHTWQTRRSLYTRFVINLTIDFNLIEVLSFILEVWH